MLKKFQMEDSKPARTPMILAYESIKNIKVYQMDVKSTFLNGDVEEEVYVKQP